MKVLVVRLNQAEKPEMFNEFLVNLGERKLNGTLMAWTTYKVNINHIVTNHISQQQLLRYI